MINTKIFKEEAIMILKTFVLANLLFSSSLALANSASDSFFRVAPYTLKHTNGSLVLNFQTSNDQSLIIDDNGESRFGFVYKKSHHYKVELKKVACGSSKEIRILDANTQDVQYKTILPPAPCQNFEGPDDFVFGFISDTQQNLDRHEDIAKTIAYHHSILPLQFLINGGDVVQEGAQEQDWINYFKGGKAYLMDIPQIAAIGNHDYRGTKDNVMPKYFQQFMRWNGSDQSGNLFFDFPEVQLLILNSNFSKLDKAAEEKTWIWIEEKMKEAQKINKPIIVATHFPVFSSSVNDLVTMSVIKLRKNLVPLAEKYKAAFILSGHTHMYERSLKDGIKYIIAGPAGGRAFKPSAKNKYIQFIDKDSLTFTKIKLSHKVFSIETYNQDNKMIDSLEIDTKK
jgi:predicted phosphodiesterase